MLYPSRNSPPFRFQPSLYQQLAQRIAQHKRVQLSLTPVERVLFSWVFRVRHAARFAFSPLRRVATRRPPLVTTARRTAPTMNLRCYALYAAVMRHGKAAAAYKLISSVIILLTETTPLRSGCGVVNGVIRMLEPAVGLWVYRRGRNFYSMPIPLWPARRTFLAVRFLIQGARRRQRLYRVPFRTALYSEILDMYVKKPDCFTMKIFKRYRKKVFASELQAWRAKKRKY